MPTAIKKSALLILLGALSFGGNAFAEDGTGAPATYGSTPAHPQQNIQQVKARILSRIEARQQKLSSLQSCVNAAADRQGLRACRSQYGHREGRRDRWRDHHENENRR